ncbi:MAG: two-component system, OmpR family, sensor histidine kinase KdpD [Actinomycetota bacterium]|nr:two-component system, OmpR family, sensor histidine kinase KdpD [Actinomycetota bacterium]
MAVRGELRVHLGAAPGVGKTFAMLDEARRRHGRGARVVVASVDTQGRAPLAAMLTDLSVVPYRIDSDDIDVGAVLAAAPEVVIVDRLAHANRDGSPRWRDVETILESGCDVIATLNVSEIESLRDVSTEVLGAPAPATVPDSFLGISCQIELADMTPQALQRRLAHGTILQPDELDPVLANQFRLENLVALRQLALRWLADRVDTDAPSARECVAVALSGSPASEVVVRRAAQLAARLHAPLLGIHVRARRAGAVDLSDQRALVESLGGSYREVVGDDIADALVRTALASGATQIVLGSPGTRRSLVSQVVADAAGLDVHVIGSSTATTPPIPARLPGALSRRRVAGGWVLAVAGLPAVTAVLVAARAHVDVSSALLVELLVVIAVAALGGATPALAAAVGASALVNWYLTPPYHRWRIAAFEDVLALAVFLIVGSVVGTFVATAARRSAEASRARAEAATLAGLAAFSVEDDPLGALVERLRAAFGLRGVAVLQDGHHEAVAGNVEHDDATTVRLPLGDDGELVLTGRVLTSEDQSVLHAFTDHLQGALRARGFQRAAMEAHALAEADELRNALLTAVSHDLRTPLASIKASISGLLQQDVEWPADAVRSFLVSVDEETDRLDSLVGNLLDMSRLRTGALQMLLSDVGPDEIVSAALNSLGPLADHVVVDVAESLPRVSVDPALLERALANVIGNAVQATGDASQVRVEAGTVGALLHIRVVDRGPGIARGDRERVFQPFQRLGDRTSNGVGLGLAVARGFVEAMHGDLTVEDTPGGGATMVVRLPVVA